MMDRAQAGSVFNSVIAAFRKRYEMVSLDIRLVVPCDEGRNRAIHYLAFERGSALCDQHHKWIPVERIRTGRTAASVCLLGLFSVEGYQLGKGLLPKYLFQSNDLGV